MILAIDTSTDQASIALAERGQTRAEWSWWAGGNHSRHLTRAIQELLALEEVSVADLGAVVVAIGPGSFSGVRVGVSVAKGLAMARQIPLAGIGTLDVIGFQACWYSPDVWAVLPAGRGQVYAAHYIGSPDTWRRDREYAIASPAEVAGQVWPADLLAGEGAEVIAAVLRERGQQPVLEPAPWRLRRAGFLAELGRRYYDGGGVDQLDQLEPLYLRRSAAEEKRAAQREE